MTDAPAPSLFQQITRGWRGYVLIALIALASGLFGATKVPPLDIDEARFAQATRQMIESDDYVRIRLQDQDRNRKPIGIHWLQAASVHTFAPLIPKLNTIWPYRIPSALGLALAALATMWAGAALLPHRTALIGAGLFATSLLAGLEGMIAKTDSVMVGFTTLALAALAQLYARKPRPRLTNLIFWAAIGAGVLVKGPITPLIAALTLGALYVWERKAAWMKPLLWWPGPILALAITLPWLISIGIVTNGAFYTELLANELGPKVAGVDHSHGGLPGYYVLLLPLLIFPATYALPAAARISFTAIRAPRDDESQAALRFLLCWAVPTFLLFEFFPTKLVHYTLPAYPAIALLCAAGLMAMRTKQWRTMHPLGAVLFGLFGALIVGLTAFVATYMPGGFDADFRRALSAGIIGALVLIASIVGLSLVKRPTARAGILIACALALSFTLRERTLPEARSLFVSQEAVAALTRARMMPRDEEPFWVVGYSQPSLIFLTRTSIRMAQPEDMAAQAQPGDSLVMEGRVLERTRALLLARGLVFEEVEAPARGMALGRGENTTLHIGRVRAVSAETGSEAAAGPRR